MKPSEHAILDQLFLGIDTGGTYTDAVLWSEANGIVAKAKALTTRYDLSVGIGGAVDAVLAASAAPPTCIKLVSMSTTLATNALVEGQGDRSALVLIGFTEADLAKDGLGAATSGSPVVYCSGGHDVFGNARELDLSPLLDVLPSLAQQVSSIAVCSLFAVRNPEHELRAEALIREKTDLPVTMSHELSAQLGGPKRALTTFLNARLISMIARLVQATESFLTRRAIDAPVMVVRGDGSLISSNFARARPIETILSGPAASLVGAQHLTNLEDAVVADIGGTTTDVAILDKGRPRINPEGASVGGFRTMVEAIAMHTFGLGGDSEVALSVHGLDANLTLGPRRLIPLSLAEMLHGNTVVRELERQLRSPNPGRYAGRFVIRTGVPEKLASGLTSAEEALYSKTTITPAALDGIVTFSTHNTVISRLVARGLVNIIGFTPSDAAHALGKQSNWSVAAAGLGAELFRRQKDGAGREIAQSAEALSEWVLSEVTRQSAVKVLHTVLAEDGLEPVSAIAHPLVQKALHRKSGIAGITINLDRPVIGLGASAALHHAGIPHYLGNRCEIPNDADVANAVGAVVGQVRVAAEAQVSQPVNGVFRVTASTGVQDFPEEGQAIAVAESTVRALAASRAKSAGTDSFEISIKRDLRTAIVEGERTFIDAAVIAHAVGRPRIAIG
ncbi:hydantoinase/oxoprolinase N-terminal domain-containing protein [Sinorhizobium meliloti]|uniref:hydantoinase/oxoprolinase N-terminal domain-containing protein n=1 Tax=Rhizobium meliloti TaxID=382 RepID=UPI000FD8E8A3|nr:hydantoinase/oxoprolinase family protein [Sinorhizobium meliloti]RVG78018.1 hydantoinase/oxoprolinase family protein [Sinorhizobium meliloti]RVI32115.1 hydantoinase/oxoprolinase family protein [Sinorhizobium meliloti]RVI43976.1 hydantoinase/oxoprolinase family protein [Sinorhizobium meliloti]RVJ18824.1 hydantoinase/oxoprolinase family protein [Sinorhizobium meliloti]RVJ92636.1 hydantoinase/oxoprolinase family protein [Sinorhizobium meliloti]